MYLQWGERTGVGCFLFIFSQVGLKFPSCICLSEIFKYFDNKNINKHNCLKKYNRKVETLSLGWSRPSGPEKLAMGNGGWGGYFLKHNSFPSPNTYMFKHCSVDWLLCLFSEESALSSGLKAQIVLLLNQTWVPSLVCSKTNLMTLGCAKESEVFSSGHIKQPNSPSSTKNFSKAFLKSRWGRGVPGMWTAQAQFSDRLMVR